MQTEMHNSEQKSRKAQSYYASSISNEKSMLKLKLMKKATALCCAFAVSLIGLPEIHVNAQTKEMQCEIQQTGSTVVKQGIVQTFEKRNVEDESELRDAISSCPTGGTVSINLKRDFNLTQDISINGNKSVYISSDNHVTIGAQKEMERMFMVEDGSYLRFSSMTLQGSNKNTNVTRAILISSGGTIELNNCTVRRSKGALVDIRGNGKVAAGNTSFVEANGTINNCGGAIQIESGEFHMGGTSEISNNTYGGVHVSSNGVFFMNGGCIRNNRQGAGHNNAQETGVNYGMGGGVYCNGVFNFRAGTIYGNHASKGGSGIVVSSTGQMCVGSEAQLTNSGEGENELWLDTPKIIFESAPTVPMKTRLSYTATIGTEIAKCSKNVIAASCMNIEGVPIINNPENPTSIISSGKFSITFEPNGATGKSTITTQKEYKSTVQLPTDYKKTGYRFTGWKENKSGKIYDPGSIQTVLADTTYTAVYEEKNVTVNFNLNHPDAKLSKGNTAIVKFNSTLTLSLYVPVVTGYKFEGWYTDKKLKGSKITSVSPAKLGVDTTIELYAKWSATSSNSNGGNSSTNTGSTTNKNTNTTSTTTTNKGSVTTITQPTKAPSSAPTTSGWLSIDRTKLTMVIGEKYQIIASSDTGHVTMRSDSNCVTVNNSGTIRAKRAGTATITVTSGTNTKKCRVKVKAAPKASDIKVKAKTVKKGKTVSVKPVFANNTDCMYVYYSSANTKVATVSSSGKVKGLKKGTAKITIKCSTGAKKVVKIKVV